MLALVACSRGREQAAGHAIDVSEFLSQLVEIESALSAHSLNRANELVLGLQSGLIGHPERPGAYGRAQQWAQIQAQLAGDVEHDWSALSAAARTSDGASTTFRTLLKMLGRATLVQRWAEDPTAPPAQAARVADGHSLAIAIEGGTDLVDVENLHFVVQQALASALPDWRIVSERGTETLRLEIVDHYVRYAKDQIGQRLDPKPWLRGLEERTVKASLSGVVHATFEVTSRNNAKDVVSGRHAELKLAEQLKRDLERVDGILAVDIARNVASVLHAGKTP